MYKYYHNQFDLIKFTAGFTLPKKSEILEAIAKCKLKLMFPFGIVFCNPKDQFSKKQGRDKTIVLDTQFFIDSIRSVPAHNQYNKLGYDTYEVALVIPMYSTGAKHSAITGCYSITLRVLLRTDSEYVRLTSIIPVPTANFRFID